MTDQKTSHAPERLRVVVRGAVQGVGFRPFVYRLATELNLTGWVSNTSAGVFIEVQGDSAALKTFLLGLQSDHPPRASIQSLESTVLDACEFKGFEIRHSTESGPKTVLLLPDIATCDDCLSEVFDPENRRYRYPFTNCTNCGPRFTIIESLPYDRARTSMKDFPMCADCEREYHDPANRRFHAQPNACPVCGPQLEVWESSGTVVARADEALLYAARAVTDGSIVAVKGIGGFHLVVDAASDRAVRRLRERKHREEKPFALMYPSMEAVHSHCNVSDLEERLLRSPECPIVLLERRTASISPEVAPHNPFLGVMLPYSPLHHLLMHELGRPVVATSGNLSDEPIATEEREALRRLEGIADCFLVHNRPIVRHVDDSIVRIIAGREMVMRRARGFAPLPVRMPHSSPTTVLAVGAHLKNAVALSNGQNVFISQHIGDLETNESREAFRNVIKDLTTLYESSPQEIACDLHPDYLSTQFARAHPLMAIGIQHHWAHVASCMAENELDGEILGVSWDGTGYGTDGTVWGGEFLISAGESFERVAALRPFRLPGGEQAIREPRRSALGLLAELYPLDQLRSGDLIPGLFTPEEMRLLLQMIDKGVNAPRTSSVGRLFDGIASLAALRHTVRYEGQAAMELEFAVTPGGDDAYECVLRTVERSASGGIRDFVLIDWEQVVRGVLSDVREGIDRGTIARRFHNALTDVIAQVAVQLRIPKVALTGGCFQNRYLTERTIRVLRAQGFQVYWHQRVPPNDGGIALGQVYARLLQQRRT